MEIKNMSKLIANIITRNVTSKNGIKQLLGARYSSQFKNENDDEEVVKTYYNRRGGKSGNFNKYYANEDAFTFDSQSIKRFKKERPGEYYSFESFLEVGRQGQNFNIQLEPVDWSSIVLPDIKKNLYLEPDVVKNRTDYEVNDFRESHNLIIKGDNLPNPILHFSDYQFPDKLQKAIDELKFIKPMPIQSQTWPIAISGMDLIGIGQTGSGKTLGFLIPAIVHSINQRTTNKTGPTALILAPTRELSQQIHAVLMDITKYMDIKVNCLYGGINKRAQINEVLNNPMICVSTPGRLLDLLQLKVTSMQNCTFLVLDEADRMLDMGFEGQIRQIVSQIRPIRQTLMWSATWPDNIQLLAREFLCDPVQINVGSSDIYANPNITQEIISSDKLGKIRVLKEIVNKEMETPLAKILIFVETKKTATLLNMRLQRKGIACSDLHGDHAQLSRNRVVNAFKKGIINIVIATDVASRGLDVNDISLVINFSMPSDIETYVHRIGRTGRAGKKGRSISIFTEDDNKLVGPLIRILQECGQEVPRDLHHMNRRNVK